MGIKEQAPISYGQLNTNGQLPWPPLNLLLIAARKLLGRLYVPLSQHTRLAKISSSRLTTKQLGKDFSTTTTGRMLRASAQLNPHPAVLVAFTCPMQCSARDHCIAGQFYPCNNGQVRPAAALGLAPCDSSSLTHNTHMQGKHHAFSCFLSSMLVIAGLH